MSRRFVAVPLALALAACASATPPPEAAAGPVPEVAEPRATPAGWAISVVGTPFALGFKTVVCAASLVVAGPIAGVLVLSPYPSDQGLEILGDGIASNCGPPYVVSPYAAS